MVRVVGSRPRNGALIAVASGVTAGLLLIAFVGDGFGGGSDSGAGVSGAVATAPLPEDPVAIPAPSVLPPLGEPTASPPSSTGLANVLAGPLSSDLLGPRVGVSVVDAESGARLYASNDTTPMVPASITKLVTAVSALELVGGASTVETRVVAGDKPGRIVLVGGGDPTLTRSGDDAIEGSASLDDLAAATARALSAASTTRVRLLVDDTLFTGPRTGPGWLPGDLATGLVSPVSALTLNDPTAPLGTPAPPDPALAAAAVFADGLRARGIGVDSVRRGAATADAAELAAARSPTVEAMVEHMLSTSDNDVAEALAHLAGVAAGTGGSFAGGVAAAGQALTRIGVDPAGVQLVDGSGISPQDRATAAAIGDVLARAARGDRPALAPLLWGLPVAGVSGSLADRFVLPATTTARGRVRAKTGTLTGVNALGGTVLDADGRRLVLVVLADRTSTDTERVRAALDRVAAAVESCGCA